MFFRWMVVIYVILFTGHSDAILNVSFSPDGTRLASGGGDATVRFWDILTTTPLRQCKGHKHHVLTTSWSPGLSHFIPFCTGSLSNTPLYHFLP